MYNYSMTTKTCTKCNVEKNIEEFYKRSASKDGYATECKLCAHIRIKNWSDSIKNGKQKIKDLPRIIPPKKVCAKCHIEKDISEFRLYPRNRDGHASYCIECWDEKSHDRRINNPQLYA